MAKVIITCGKICSGKSFYAKKIKEELNAVIISPDEATYELINNEQGEFYDIFSKRLNHYLKGLLKKLESIWEEPTEDEVDVIYKVDKGR